MKAGCQSPHFFTHKKTRSSRWLNLETKQLRSDLKSLRVL
nr:MAG TPA: hypothetical protein [Caudoviricetes sp.]